MDTVKKKKWAQITHSSHTFLSNASYEEGTKGTDWGIKAVQENSKYETQFIHGFEFGEEIR